MIHHIHGWISWPIPRTTMVTMTILPLPHQLGIQVYNCLLGLSFLNLFSYYKWPFETLLKPRLSGDSQLSELISLVHLLLPEWYDFRGSQNWLLRDWRICFVQSSSLKTETHRRDFRINLPGSLHITQLGRNWFCILQLKRYVIPLVNLIPFKMPPAQLT